MDSKDFIKMIKEKLKDTQKKSLSVYSYKQRQSRPRVKKDILRDKVKTSNCVTNDCTHDWGGHEN
jgi:hypothetical protein